MNRNVRHIITIMTFFFKLEHDKKMWNLEEIMAKYKKPDLQPERKEILDKVKSDEKEDAYMRKLELEMQKIDTEHQEEIMKKEAEHKLKLVLCCSNVVVKFKSLY